MSIEKTKADPTSSVHRFANAKSTNSKDQVNQNLFGDQRQKGGNTLKIDHDKFSSFIKKNPWNLKLQSKPINHNELYNERENIKANNHTSFQGQSSLNNYNPSNQASESKSFAYSRFPPQSSKPSANTNSKGKSSSNQSNYKAQHNHNSNNMHRDFSRSSNQPKNHNRNPNPQGGNHMNSNKSYNNNIQNPRSHGNYSNHYQDSNRSFHSNKGKANSNQASFKTQSNIRSFSSGGLPMTNNTNILENILGQNSNMFLDESNLLPSNSNSITFANNPLNISQLSNINIFDPQATMSNIDMSEMIKSLSQPWPNSGSINFASLNSMSRISIPKQEKAQNPTNASLFEPLNILKIISDPNALSLTIDLLTKMLEKKPAEEPVPGSNAPPVINLVEKSSSERSSQATFGPKSMSFRGFALDGSQANETMQKPLSQVEEDADASNLSNVLQDITRPVLSELDQNAFGVAEEQNCERVFEDLPKEASMALEYETIQSQELNKEIEQDSFNKSSNKKSPSIGEEMSKLSALVHEVKQDMVRCNNELKQEEDEHKSSPFQMLQPAETPFSSKKEDRHSKQDNYEVQQQRISKEDSRTLTNTFCPTKPEEKPLPPSRPLGTGRTLGFFEDSASLMGITRELDKRERVYKVLGQDRTLRTQEKNILEKLEKFIGEKRHDMGLTVEKKVEVDSKSKEDIQVEEEQQDEFNFDNRYFMYNPTTVCRRCKRPGHFEKWCSNDAVLKCGFCVGNHRMDECEQVVCFGCYKMGHRLRDCQMRGSLTCYRCGKKGHKNTSCGVMGLRNRAMEPEEKRREMDRIVCVRCGRYGHINCTFQNFDGDDLYVNEMSMNGLMNVEEEETRDRQERGQNQNVDILRLLNSYQNM